MDASELEGILRQKESATLDFKIKCNAFHGSRAENAELLKDICAMANNGNRRSILVVGVSDDGRELRSVENGKLTDDAVQGLVRQGLAPIPRVRLHDVTFVRDGEPVALKVIVVGPNKRQAYHFAVDAIDYQQRFCHRKHEVWVRRRATSDLASPAEVARLVAGEDLGSPASGPGVVFSRLPQAERAGAILETLGAASDHLVVDPALQVARILVGGKVLVLRLIYEEAFGPKQDLSSHTFVGWAFEHGVLVVSPGRPPAKYFKERLIVSPSVEVIYREAWGTYAIVNVDGSGARTPRARGLFTMQAGKSIKNGPPVQFTAFVLADVKDASSLIRRVRELLGFLDEEGIRRKVLSVRDTLMQALRAADREEQVLLASSALPATKPRPGHVTPVIKKATMPPESKLIENPRRFGKGVVVEVATAAEYLSAVRFTLEASRRRLTEGLPAGRVRGGQLLDRAWGDFTRAAGEYHVASVAPDSWPSALGARKTR